MKILALEFSSEQRSVAIMDGGQCLATASLAAGRATPAFALVERVLAEAKMEREEIECIAIGLGPGSYTGIRTAISLAQGWQLGLQTKLLGISSVECLAETAARVGIQGKASLIVDAQRNEFYRARYDFAAGKFALIEPLKIVSMEEVCGLQAQGETTVGPDAEKWFAHVANAKTLHPQAETLGAIASQQTDFVPGEKLEPIYLREISFVKAPPSRVLPVDLQ